ncbi:transporter [Tardiphaga sp.]|uniref:transporter n=1 Tax=Tardiphaga sp. TaxID=1926292 RepID=UPI0025F7632D|nr:transporter [Tardiphaga sp.]
MSSEFSSVLLAADRGAVPEIIPGLVWAFRIHSNGTPEALPVDAAIDMVHGDLLWLHFNLTDSRALQWLAHAELHAPEQGRALLLSKDTYQQLHSAADSVYGVISDLLRDIDEVTEETGYLRFLMTERFLISGRHHALCAVDATRRSLEGGRRVDGVAALLETIIENVADTMDNVADRIAVALDEIEEQVLSGNSKDMLARLGRLRRTCVRLHRQLSGLRIVFHRLEHKGVDGLKPALQLRAGKLAQRLDGLDHRVVEMRERSRLLQEELHLQIEEQGNDSLRVLSVLTALLLPPTLITGVFGMNTKGLPFTDNENAFLWAALLLVLSSASAYLVMKRIGLIR